MKKYLEGLVFGVTGLLIGMSCWSIAAGTNTYQLQVTAPVVSGTRYANFTAASSVINTQEGFIAGVFCASASSTPTLQFYDYASASVSSVLTGVFTPAAATYYVLPFHYNNGLYVATGGTINCTVSYQ